MLESHSKKKKTRWNNKGKIPLHCLSVDGAELAEYL